MDRRNSVKKIKDGARNAKNRISKSLPKTKTRIIVLLSLIQLILLFLIILTFSAQSKLNLENTQEILPVFANKFGATETVSYVERFTTKEYPIDSTKIISSTIQPYATLEGDVLKITPDKNSSEDTIIYLSDSEKGLIKQTFKIANKKNDWAALEQRLFNVLGGLKDQYAFYIHDLTNGDTYSYRGEVQITPASIAKTGTAILIMRDVEAGKYNLEKTFPYDRSKAIWSSGELGAVASGTPITIGRYLDLMIKQSDNNSWMMLNESLGGNWGGFNDRIIAELGANPFFMDPFKSTANVIGKVYTDLYYAKTLKPETRDQLFNIMRDTVPWGKEAIGAGLPAGVDFVNKIGTLWTETEISFQDAAIVWGPKSTYVFVVLDVDVEWEPGLVTMRQLSSEVYNFLNQ
jgi:beta-lactamase class A